MSIFSDLARVTSTAALAAELSVPSLPEPQPLDTRVVTEGDPNHEHRFELVEWNRDKLGSNLTDMDSDPGGAFATPMGTYHDFLRCQCGREVVKSERALI